MSKKIIKGQNCLSLDSSYLPLLWHDGSWLVSRLDSPLFAKDVTIPSPVCDRGITLFIYLGFYVAFNTVQVISRRVVGRAEETGTYSSLGFCTVNCRPTASNYMYQLSHLRPWRGSNPSLRGGRRECYHSVTVAPIGVLRIVADVPVLFLVIYYYLVKIQYIKMKWNTDVVYTNKMTKNYSVSETSHIVSLNSYN